MDAATSALLDALAALITAALADVGLSATIPDALQSMSATSAGATDAQATALEIVAHAQLAITLLTLSATAQPTRSVVVQQRARGTETIFAIAQRELGDMLRWTDIQRMNNLTFIALTAGQVLLLPTS